MATVAPTPPFRLNYGEAFTFIFRDPRWLRKGAFLILFSLLSVFIIPWFFVLGYILAISERVARLEERALPDWADFGALLRKGWRVFLVRLVYYLPIWLAYLIIVGLVVGAIIVLGGVGLFSGNPGSPSGGQGALAAVLFLLIVPLALLIVPLALLIPCLTPAADAQLVLHEGEVEPAFRFGQVLRFIRRNLGQYILMVVIYVGGTQFVSGGFSVSFQISGGLVDSSGDVNAAIVAMVALAAILAIVAITLFTIYLRCALAHMVGQLCWHEREVASHAP